MIKLENVNKYFFLGKPNEIHVINNTTMEMPTKGIVCLLGPSGCGKTTLLNVIGGLDKVNSGSIYVDVDPITRVSVDRIDTVRNAKIGYIFQNFNLLGSKTVFENVAIALNMVGVTDKKQVEERVNYCLEEVGIYQYRNKLADSLSGGQRQRVAIARAIVKNPSIIIADEPTGNLDSANTLEIMNIIKSISRDRLVILVTHEKNIAQFYSDYVAEMSDGKIVKAYTNDKSRSLDYQLDNKIYLQDMNVQKAFGGDDCHVEIYADDEIDTPIKLVIRGGNIYIDTNGRFNVLDGNANVELIDDSYKAIDESFFDESTFEYNAFLPEDFSPKYTSIYRIGNMFKKGWETVKSFKKIRKILLLGFVFAAMFTFLAVSNVIGIFDVQPKDYLTTSSNYITVSNPRRTDELIDYVNSLGVTSYAIPGDTKKSITIPLNDYLQTAYASVDMNVSISETSTLRKSQLIYGRLPEKENEVVLDALLIKKFIDDGYGTDVGITKVKQFINRKIEVKNLEPYVIVGICDNESPSLYVDESQVMYILTNADSSCTDEDSIDMNVDTEEDPIRSGKVKDIEISDSEITIKKGEKPKKLNTVILNEAEEGEYKIGSDVDVVMSGKKLEVVGFYSSDKPNEETMYVSSNTIRADYIYDNGNFTVYADNVTQAQKMLEVEGISSKINMEREKTLYIQEVKDSLLSSLIVAGIILLVSLIEMFLMLRSSFMARIKEVGTLRAIGLKKNDIYRMFTGEILVISFVTAIPGILLMYFIMSKLIMITDYLEGMYMVNPLIALISLGIVVAFNLIAGLIPVARTLRKTPAEILARIDI